MLVVAVDPVFLIITRLSSRTCTYVQPQIIQTLSSSFWKSHICNLSYHLGYSPLSVWLETHCSEPQRTHPLCHKIARRGFLAIVHTSLPKTRVFCQYNIILKNIFRGPICYITNNYRRDFAAYVTTLQLT